MININMINHISKSALFALTGSITIVSMMLMTFFIAEPTISHGVASDPFYIRQTITDETSFLAQPTNVTMSGSGINGVTGGNATGTTQFVVTTNNAAGYNVTITYTNNAGAYAMYGDEDGDESLRDYSGDVGGQPSYNFTASTAAQFAYSVSASTSADADQSFLTNGSNACNTLAGSDAAGANCWKAPSTTAFTIIDRDSAAITGATSTIFFKVHVPSGANPVPSAQTYTATATLTLTAN